MGFDLSRGNDHGTGIGRDGDGDVAYSVFNLNVKFKSDLDYGASYGFHQSVFLGRTMNLVRIFSPRGTILLEGGPGITSDIILTAGAIAAITKDISVGTSRLIIVMIVNFGDL